MRHRTINLHVGCGTVRLDGWINMDLDAFPGMDIMADARIGLPFRDGSVLRVFAEHFIEHLTREEGGVFLRECHRILKPREGILRLSTPNLDWVWVTHYRWPADPALKRSNCAMLNQGFYGWGHRFLYNDTVLADQLTEAGFREHKFFDYGASDRTDLADLERHEKSPDLETLPHVIIAQAYR
jgi:predicted SAM-dependent methyltransferase